MWWLTFPPCTCFIDVVSVAGWYVLVSGVTIASAFGFETESKFSDGKSFPGRFLSVSLMGMISSYKFSDVDTSSRGLVSSS